MTLPYRGAVITLLLVLVLLTPPSELVDREGAFADTRGDVTTASAIPVDLQDGLRGDPGDVVPRELGNWTGEDDTSWNRELSEYLAYDSLLVRDYGQPGLYRDVQVMILTARQSRAFHNPEVCFRVQGGEVTSLPSTSMPAPEAPDGVDARVGRLLIEYPEHDGEPPRLVYNLYVVERHDAAPDRTTWIRLSLTGVNPENLDPLEPLLVDLLEELTPYLFHGTGESRTMFQWIARAAGWPVAGVAAAAALVPVAVDGWRHRRRKP